MTLSYSSIQRHGYSYNDNLYGCAFSYYLKYIIGVEPTQIDSKYARFGQIIHDIVANFYPSIISGNIGNYPHPKPYFEQILNNLLVQKWDYSLTEKQYKDAVEILKSFSELEGQRYTTFQNGDLPAFLPKHIELPINEPFNIRIDKVLYDDTMVDYKTAKDLPGVTGLAEDISQVPIENILQAGLYAMSYNAKFSTYPNRMVFHFMRFNIPLIVPITQEVIEISSRIANDVTDNINKRTFKKNSQSCEWCDMRHVCGLETINIL